jgi:Ni/Fe-hydrogenase subunit HybB-like protein
MSAMMARFKSANPLLFVWLLVLATFIGLGIFGAVRFMGRSESESLPWGLLVPSYIFFALSAAGVSLINSISTVFQVERFKPVAKRGIWLSLMLIVPALIFIILDLGKTTHAANLFLYFQASSRLAWMSVFYTIFGIFLALQLITAIREERMPKWITLAVGAVVFLVTLTIETNSGAFFGALAAKPLWNSPFMPLSFVVSALLVGACLHIVFVSVSYMSRKKSLPGQIEKVFTSDYRVLLIGLILINLVVIAAKIIPELNSAEAAPYAKLLVSGSYSGTFWGLEVVAGCLIPLAILLYKKTGTSAKWLLVSAAMITLGIFFSKYDLIIAGQSIGPTFTTAFIPYFPSVYEILTVVGGLAVCLLAFTLGELWLPLEPDEKPAWFVFAKKAPSLKRGVAAQKA